jgi:hypothetical protein
MELTQKLKDLKKEKTENDKYIQHYNDAHDKLKLEDIECVSHFWDRSYI